MSRQECTITRRSLYELPVSLFAQLLRLLPGLFELPAEELLSVLSRGELRGLRRGLVRKTGEVDNESSFRPVVAFRSGSVPLIRLKKEDGAVLTGAGLAASAT